MSFGDFASGMASSFGDYVTSERTKNREREDTQLSEQMELIKSLLQSPNINPNIVGRALTDLATLGAAKNSKRTQKGGNEGFMGASELPVSQLLAGVMNHTMPVQGPTTRTIQTPKEMGLMGNVAMPNPRLMGFDGKAIMEAPVSVPPEPYAGPPDMKRILSAARDVQKYGAGGQAPLPDDQQPLYRDPREMGMEKASIQADTQGYLANAALQQKINSIRQYVKDPEQQQIAIEAAMGVPSKVQGAPQKYTYTDQNGEEQIGLAIIKNGVMEDAATGLPLPSNAKWYQPERNTSIDQMIADAISSGNDKLADELVEKYRKMHPGSTVNIGRNAAGLTGAQQVTQQRALQLMWNKESAALNTMSGQYQLMKTGLQRAAAGDMNGGSQAVLVTFQKILDPNSVVRESEYARSATGIGLLSHLEGMYEKVKSGGAGVPIADLQEMVKTAQQFITGLQGSLQVQKKQIQADAFLAGLDESAIFGTGNGLNYDDQGNPHAIPPPPNSPRIGQEVGGKEEWDTDAQGNPVRVR